MTRVAYPTLLALLLGSPVYAHASASPHMHGDWWTVVLGVVAIAVGLGLGYVLRVRQP